MDEGGRVETASRPAGGAEAPSGNAHHMQVRRQPAYETIEHMRRMTHTCKEEARRALPPPAEPLQLHAVSDRNERGAWCWVDALRNHRSFAEHGKSKQRHDDAEQQTRN